MRKWIQDRVKRRDGKGGNKPAPNKSNQPEPLQPTFLDREPNDFAAKPAVELGRSVIRQPKPVFEAQPEQDPTDIDAVEADDVADEAAAEAPAGEPAKRRRRSRGGRNRRRKPAEAPSIPVNPGELTGEAAEVEGVPPGDGTGAAAKLEPPPATPKTKGAVILAIGLPGSGKTSWFKRHEITPLSSDLIRGLLFDDATEQRFQDLVFSTLRYMLRMRMQAGRELNYIDATNLSPRERSSWIRMAKDFNFEAHAVFFDVPTEVCMERNRKRERNVPDDVMLRMAAKLRPPQFDEGFSKITVVRLKSAAAED